MNQLKDIIEENEITIVINGQKHEYFKQEYKNDNLLAWLQIEKIEAIDDKLYLYTEKEGDNN
jgi:hypothetical protein